jgi:hypothetical protein
MGLEAATYIEDLVGTNPTGADDTNQGDNHLRLIKDVLQSQFPSLGAAAVSLTAAQINESVMPTGMIMMWHSTSATIPAGWALCDGGSGTPNLVGRFVLASTAPNVTGGSSDIIIPTSGSTAITTAQLPPHTHGMGSTMDLAAGGTGNFAGGGTGFGIRTATNSAGSGAGHTHAGSTLTGANVPLYYSLCYIMKL